MIMKATRTKKIKSPPGYLSKVEVLRMIDSKTDFFITIKDIDAWIDKGLFPTADSIERNSNTYFWDKFLVEKWLRSIPDECKGRMVSVSLIAVNGS